MNNKIYQWSSLVVESEDEPSYNDILIIAKKVGESEDMMTPEDYESLSDEEKEQIFNTRKLVSQLQTQTKPLVDILKFDKIALKANAQASILKDQEKEHVYVHYIEQSFNHEDVLKWRETLANSNNPEDILRLKVGDYQIDNNDVQVCEDIQSARKFVSQRMKSINEQFGVTAKDFILVKKEEIPPQILEVDPNAMGFRYQSFEAEYDPSTSLQRGVQQYYKHDDQVKTPNEWAKELGIQAQLFRKQILDGRLTGYERVNKDGSAIETDDNKTPNSITKDMVFTYWIYKATQQVARTNVIDEIAKALENLDLSWTERGDMTRRAKELSQKPKYATKSDTEKALKDLKDMNKNLDTTQSQKEFDFDDIGDEDSDFNFDIDPNGEDLSDNLSSDEDVSLASDDEIMQAAKEEGKESEDDEEDSEEDLARDKEEQAKSSFDYGTDSDDQETSDSDTHQQNYGGLQSAWGVDSDDEEIKKQNAEREANTKYSLRGVPLSKKQFDKIQALAKTEEGRNKIPKTAEDVVQWKKSN